MNKRNQPNLFPFINRAIDHLYLREGLKHFWSFPDGSKGSDCRNPDPYFSLGSCPTRLNNPFDSLSNYAISQRNLPYPGEAVFQNSSTP